jgi:acetyl-CoA acetyltransferase
LPRADAALIGGQYLLATMCVGGGKGVAAIFEAA